MWSRLLVLALLLLPAPALADAKEKVAALAPSGLVLVMDADGNELVAQNADKPFVPASVTKIVTAWLALEVLGKLQAFAKQRYVSPMEFAWIHFALEQPDQGFRWLTKASEDRAFELIHLKVDARFDPLRDDRRFAAIMKRLGLDQS